MTDKACAHCGQLFTALRNPKQTYCSAPECQQARKRQWQERQRHNDPDFAQARRDAQRKWAQQNPDYWRKYRQSRQQYAVSNRKKQRQRNVLTRSTVIAKTDASNPLQHLRPGLYAVRPAPSQAIAKTDALLVEITFISSI